MLSRQARHYVYAGLVLTGTAIAGAAVFVTSGIYNVSAAREHLDVTTLVLEASRRASVRTYSLGIDAPPLDEPGMVRLGAAYFEHGCAPCHGAPGRPSSPISRAMLPEAPALGEAIDDWSTEELFWIVHNGQKYTGMPAWLAYEREDEVWPLVAFMETLPGLNELEYRELAAGLGTGRAPEPFLETPTGEELAICIGCHGTASGEPVNPRVPRLGGQSAAYLERALREFAAGLRESGMMTLFAENLSEAQISALARYYAAGAPAGEPPPPATGGEEAGDPEAGAEIFAMGIPEADVPACVVCHVVSPNPQYPRLDGQSARYVRQQLENWREGLRDTSDYGVIMATVGERLTPAQRADVAAYIESLPPFNVEGDAP